MRRVETWLVLTCLALQHESTTKSWRQIWVVALSRSLNHYLVMIKAEEKVRSEVTVGEGDESRRRRRRLRRWCSPVRVRNARRPCAQAKKIPLPPFPLQSARSYHRVTPRVRQIPDATRIGIVALLNLLGGVGFSAQCSRTLSLTRTHQFLAWTSLCSQSAGASIWFQNK